MADISSPRICIIGAGFSGLCMAIRLKTKLNLETFTIFEACSEVGGTWCLNTYPGCACDVPSHLYSFSFCPKYDWSHVYSPQEEILEYMKDVATQYDLYPHIRFQTRVECLHWNETELKWNATIFNSRTNREKQMEFDIVVNATGKNRIPHYPKEYLNFKGPLLHSSEWDHSVSLSGKRVGIIGTGASAVQIIIAIAPEVEHLSIFQRKAPFIMPRLQMKYSETAKWAFSKVPGLYKLSRAAIFLLHHCMYGAARYNSFLNKLALNVSRWYRSRQVEDETLEKKASPNYTIGCKRVILSENYYSTLQRNNVDLITEKIEDVEGDEVTTANGKKHKLDVLILATGHQTQDYFAPMNVFGRDGVDVLKEWKTDKPKGYLGILSWNMPNLFTIFGPYAGLGHSSNIFNIECQVEWTVLAVEKMMEKGAKCISIKKEVEEEFMRFLEEAMKGTVWANEHCGSWYLNEKGVNTALWPENQIELWKRCRTAEENLFNFK